MTTPHIDNIYQIVVKERHFGDNRGWIRCGFLKFRKFGAFDLYKFI